MDLRTGHSETDQTSAPRKIRWAGAGGGKRGGLRVIYYWAPGDQAFYMLFAYTKAAQGDLTAAQTRQLSRVVREEFK